MQMTGAVFRESIQLGVFNGSYTEARQLAFSLRPEFEGDSYNLFTKYVARRSGLLPVHFFCMVFAWATELITMHML